MSENVPGSAGHPPQPDPDVVAQPVAYDPATGLPIDPSQMPAGSAAAPAAPVADPASVPVAADPAAAPVAADPAAAPVAGDPAAAPVAADPAAAPVTADPAVAPVTADPAVAPAADSPSPELIPADQVAPDLGMGDAVSTSIDRSEMDDALRARVIVAGIDLGTTYSAIAYMDEHGKPVIIPNSDNERITPSVILFEEDEAIVGRIAKQSAVSDPENCVQFIKRDMGSNDWEKEFFAKRYTPELLSSLILKRLVQDASSYLGQSIKYVVITVPAYFGDTERKATRDAGEVAGLTVLEVLNEPTAAALAYGLDNLDKEQTVMVYDLGGGTFDVTVMEIKGGSINVLATDGEVQLGGKDWDDELINWISEEFHKEHGIDPRDDMDSYQALRDTAENAKIALSKKPKARMLCQCQGKTLKREITLEKFEDVTRMLLSQTETYLPIVLEKSKCSWDSVDSILLVGGSTRMPAVKEMLRRVSGIEPDDTINPDECVAFGAAIYATLLKLKGVAGIDLAGDEYIPESVAATVRKLDVVNVTSHSLGIAAKIAGVPKNCIMISEQSPLPAKKSMRFGTEADNQTKVEVQVLEGEAESPDECVQIGTCIISDLPPRPCGSPIEVTFHYDAEGRINVTAKDVGSNREVTTEIKRDGGMNDEEKEAEKQAIAEVEVS